MIPAGALDRRLTLLTAGDITTLLGEQRDELGQVVPDALGQPFATYAEKTTVWAQRLELRTQDAARAGGRDTYGTARFRIRWREDVSTDMRAAIDGRLYDIVAIDEPDRRESLVLTCEEASR